MINRIKNLLTNDVVSHLSNRGINALSIFNKTINDLTMINNEIETHVKFREEEIEKMMNDNKSLSEQQVFNTKIIEKINNLLD